MVDFDTVRLMFAQPHHAPWQGEEGQSQLRLGVQMVSGLAEQFSEAGWEVIILDVLTEETLALYKRRLERIPLTVLQLLPTWEAIQERNLERARREGRPRLTSSELRMVYEQQDAFVFYDIRVDNSQVAAEHLAILLAQVDDLGNVPGSFDV